MSLSVDLQQLLKRKVELENELWFLEKKEEILGVSINILEEKLVIQELKEKTRARRAIVKKLESRKKKLEKNLKKSQEKEQMEVIIEHSRKGNT